MADGRKVTNAGQSNSQRKDGSIPAEDEVRHRLRDAMKGKNRAAIAQTMTDLLGRTVTPSMLADFTRNPNGKRQPRFPLAWAKPLSIAVGSDSLVRSQLFDGSLDALSLGELLLPQLLRRAQIKLTALGKARIERGAKR
jgi:hypothetical protein